jgi:hypothetical protein
MNKSQQKAQAAFEAAKERGIGLVNSLETAVNGLRDTQVLAEGDRRPGKISLVNEEAFQLPTNMRFLGNEERFTAAYYSEPLTQYAVGWTDPENLQELINFIAPRVPVGRRFEYKLAVNAEAFLSEIDDERAIGSEFKRVEYKGTTVYSKTANRGLCYRIDLDEEGAGILTEELIVARLLQRLRRNQYRRACATLLGITASSTTSVTWTYNSVSNANPQPDEDIRTQIAAAQLTSGVFPNRVLLDLASWNLRSAAYAKQALGAGAIAAYQRSPDDVAKALGLDRLMLSKALYQSASITNTKSYILPQRSVAFFGQENPSRDDPTNLKHFVTPVGDGDFRVYRQPVGAKFVDITVEYYDNLVATATVGANQLVVS